MARTISDPIEARERLDVPAPRREVRDWIRSRGKTETAREARTFARITLSDVDQCARIDPERAADRLEAVAARLLEAARWLRRLAATDRQ